jgi:hypoxanthine phosphoribosyltransferase
VRYLSTIEASEILNISGNQVRYLIRNNRLVAKRDKAKGNELIVHIVDVNRFKNLDNMYTKQENNNPDILWIYEACKYVMYLMKLDSYIPEQIIAVAYGGLVPASIIAAKLRIPVENIKISYYDDNKERLDNPLIIKNLPDIIPNIPTLIVDDILKTGTTLDIVKNALLNRGVDETNIKTAVIHKKNCDCIIQPDWYAYLAEDWVTYPWEPKE